MRDLAIEGRFEVLLCHAPDRLARRYAYQVLLLEEFQRAGIEVIFAKEPERSGTPEDELLRQFQGMIAEYERAQIAERCRRGKLHRARGGAVSVMARAPYGYRYMKRSEHADAIFEIDEGEAPVVRSSSAATSRGTKRSRSLRGGSRRRACRPGPARWAGTTPRSGGCSAIRPTRGRPPTARRAQPARPSARPVKRGCEGSAPHGSRGSMSHPRTGSRSRSRRSSARSSSRSRRSVCTATAASRRATPAARRCCRGSSSVVSAGMRTTAVRRAARTARCVSTTAARAPTATAAPKDACATTTPFASPRSTSSSGPASLPCSRIPP